MVHQVGRVADQCMCERSGSISSTGSVMLRDGVTGRRVSGIRDKWIVYAWQLYELDHLHLTFGCVLVARRKSDGTQVAQHDRAA